MVSEKERVASERQYKCEIKNEKGTGWRRERMGEKYSPYITLFNNGNWREIFQCLRPINNALYGCLQLTD